MYFLFFLFSCMCSGEIGSEGVRFEFDNSSIQSCKVNDSSYETSVRIDLYSGDMKVGHGSGNYFKIGKYKFVVTAGHVADPQLGTYVVDDGDLVLAKAVFFDEKRDIAILKLERDLNSVRAKHWRLSKSRDLTGESINYAGYPSDLGKVVLNGIVAKDLDNVLVLQSFALPGSSGSVIFDSKGRVVGVVSAVKVEYHFGPFPQLHENVVFAGKLDYLNKKFIKGILKSDKDSGF